MKKLLLVATVLMGGVAASQAGLNISIGIGLPLPRPAIVIRHPVPHCPPRVIVPCPQVYYQPAYQRHDHRRGHDRWDRREHGRNHRR